ncbi:MAG: hypothetical protein ACOX87_13340 [Chloroflexota bacterium]
MGVWIGAMLSYSRILAPRISRIFILGQAAAGLGVLLDELFGVLYRARQGGASMPVATGTSSRRQAADPAEEDTAGPARAA